MKSSPFLLHVRLRFSVSSAVACISLLPQGSTATPPKQLLPMETGSVITVSPKMIITDKIHEGVKCLWIGNFLALAFVLFRMVW